MSDFNLGEKVSFFTWANSESINFNPGSVDNATKRKIRDLDPGIKQDVISELVDHRRKKFKASETLKLERAKKMKNNSLVSIDSTKSPASTYDDLEDEWSDCEAELSKDMSIMLEQSTSRPCNGTKVSTADKLRKLEVDEIGALSSFDSGDESNDNNHTSPEDDDDVQWSDCDEEISRNISLLEQSFSSSASRHDRSALQEISNLSRRDQQ